jgi:hypothetical protein
VCAAGMALLSRLRISHRHRLLFRSLWISLRLGLTRSRPRRKQAISNLGKLSISLFDLRAQRFELTALRGPDPTGGLSRRPVSNVLHSRSAALPFVFSQERHINYFPRRLEPRLPNCYRACLWAGCNAASEMPRKFGDLPYRTVQYVYHEVLNMVNRKSGVQKTIKNTCS